eukprot:Trichotokara_eunicae@DN5947_c0_g1_i4.p1
MRRVLSIEEEHVMVRHEVALAMGSALCASFDMKCEDDATLLAKSVEALKVYAQHKEPIVAESCQVALDNYKDEGFASLHEAQIKDTLKRVTAE